MNGPSSTPSEHFHLCSEYLYASYDAWNLVLINYDQLLGTLRTLLPEKKSEELATLLNNVKRNIELKREQLEKVHNDNLRLVQTGRNVQETQSVPFKLDELNFSRLVRVAWPQPPMKSEPSPAPRPGPPGFESKQKAVDDDEFETFETFGEERQQQIAGAAASNPPLGDLDDFDTFNTNATAADQYQPPAKTKADEFQTMQCVDFLTHKIKQKYGPMQPVALTKVYGHLSQEEGYRAAIGGSKDFPAFLARFPQYFKLSADQMTVMVLNEACSKSSEAVRGAEYSRPKEEQTLKQTKRKEHDLMAMEEYGDDFDLEVGGAVASVRPKPVMVAALANREAMSMWDIVEMVVKRLELKERFKSYDVGKQVAVEAYKLAVQNYDKTDQFGKLDPDVIVDLVRDFLDRGAEKVKRKQQGLPEHLAEGVSEQEQREWKYKTIQCTDFRSNGVCPRGGTCQFAHGPADQRPKRRTKMCSSYLAGTCRRAPEECTGAHGREMLGTVLPGQEHLTIPQPAARVGSHMGNAKNSAPAPAPSKSYWNPPAQQPAVHSSTFEDTDHNCAICMVAMRDAAQVQRLRCGHRFHKKCIADWMQKGPHVCPKCRLAIADEASFPSLKK